MNAEEKNRRDAVLRRLSKMKNVRANWEGMWAKIAKRADPKYIGLTQNPGARAAGDFDLGRQRFDSTILKVVPKWASVVSAITTPKTEKWHTLTTTEKYFNEKYSSWLDAANETLFSRRYAVKAKFEAANRESLMLLGLYGGAAMSLMRPSGESKGNFYKTWPIKEWYVDVNFQGEVDTFYRVYETSKRRFLQEFDLETLPEESKRLISEADQDKKFNVICAVYPNEYYDAEVYRAKYKKWAIVYILEESKEIIEEGGSEVAPVFYQRYDVIPDLNDPYPYSPVMMVLADQSMLNVMARALAEASDRAARPMLLGANEQIINPANIRNGRYIPGAISEQGQPLIMPMQYQGSLPYTLEMINLYKNGINEAYGLDLFQALMQKPNMTATEILQQSQMQGIVMGPVAERRESEFLGPMIELELYQAFLDGELPMMPPELAKAFLSKETELKIEYESPVRRAQRSGELQGLLEVINLALQLSEADPSTRNLINPEAALRKYARVKGVLESDVFRTKEEVEALNERAALAAQEQNSLAAGQGEAAMAKDLAQAEALSAQNNEVAG